MASGKPRLLLLNPRQRIKSHASAVGFARLIGKKAATSPLALPLLAALTPSHWEIQILDEELAGELGRIPEGPRPDLVGITALSPNVDRGYELADLFRAGGVKVVMGGPHVSYNEDEALTHADAVVKGEAEDVWGALLADFEQGRLRQRYQAPTVSEFKRLPIPRWDLVDTSKLSAVSVQASRGCPFRCDFCVARVMFGPEMRYRDLDNLIDEIKSLPLKTFLFTDDNLTANKKYARELMTRLKPLGVQWICGASIELSRETELLKQMADAGCMHILIGFESTNPLSLGEAQKKQNQVAKFGDAIERIHAAGINIIASFMVGFDHDTLEEFEQIHQLMRATNLWYAHLNIVDVIHGTDLMERVKREGRWWGRPNDLSGGMFPVIHYNHMSQTDLFDGNFRLVEKIFSAEDLYPRALGLFSSGAFAAARSNPDVSVLQKFLTSLRILWWHLATTDKWKRRLFLALLGLIRRGKLSIENAVIFLLTTEGARRQTALLRKDLDRWRARIKQADRGPWAQMPRAPSLPSDSNSPPAAQAAAPSASATAQPSEADRR